MWNLVLVIVKGVKDGKWFLRSVETHSIILMVVFDYKITGFLASEDLMLYILYSIADGEVVGSTVYDDYEIALIEAEKWHDVLVLKIEEEL